MRRKKNKVDQHSAAGKLGVASRWKDHDKKPTKLVRMYTDDYDYLAHISSNFGLPVVLLVHRCIQHIRDKHGSSAFSSTFYG